LRIYDEHTSRELYLGETKRIATPSQRIVLHASDLRCTAVVRSGSGCVKWDQGIIAGI
jgi:hypothetical protein